jgi:hypothetical protein
VYALADSLDAVHISRLLLLGSIDGCLDFSADAIWHGHRLIPLDALSRNKKFACNRIMGSLPFKCHVFVQAEIMSFFLHVFNMKRLQCTKQLLRVMTKCKHEKQHG